MRKVHYTNEPEAVIAIGSGAYYYNWDIVHEEATEDTEEHYECCQVKVYSCDKNVIKEAVIKALWGDGVEEKLINDYNAAVLGIGSQDAIDSYRAFILERDRVKELVNQAFE